MCIFVLPSHCPFNDEIPDGLSYSIDQIRFCLDKTNKKERKARQLCDHIANQLTCPENTYINRCFNAGPSTNPFLCTNPPLSGLQVRHRPTERNLLADWEDCAPCTLLARHWHKQELARLRSLQIAEQKEIDERKRRRSSSGSKSVRFSPTDEYIAARWSADYENAILDSGSSSESSPTTNGEHEKRVRFSPRQEVIWGEDDEIPINGSKHVRFSAKEVFILNEEQDIAESDEAQEIMNGVKADEQHTEGLRGLSNGHTTKPITINTTVPTTTTTNPETPCPKRVGFAPCDEYIPHPPPRIFKTAEELYSTLTITSGANPTPRIIHCGKSPTTTTSSSSSSSLSSCAISSTSASTSSDRASDDTLAEPRTTTSQYAKAIAKYERLAHDMLGRCNNTGDIHEQPCACVLGRVGDKYCGVTRVDKKGTGNGSG